MLQKHLNDIKHVLLNRFMQRRIPSYLVMVGDVCVGVPAEQGQDHRAVLGFYCEVQWRLPVDINCIFVDLSFFQQRNSIMDVMVQDSME